MTTPQEKLKQAEIILAVLKALVKDYKKTGNWGSGLRMAQSVCTEQDRQVFSAWRRQVTGGGCTIGGALGVRHYSPSDQERFEAIAPWYAAQVEALLK